VDVFAKARILRRLGREDTLPRRSLTHPLAVRETPGPVEHRVRHYLAAIEELGIPTHKPEFFAPAGQTPAPEAGTVLLSPDSDFGSSHEWELERWLEIGRALAEASVTVTVAGMPGGRGLGRSLAAQLGGDTPFFEAAPGAAMLPLLAVHSVVVAADGSLPHLAAHAGATCLTLFGPNDPAWRRPLGRRHSVVRRHVECAPCFLAKCPIDHRCLRELEAGRVLAALRAALETAATSAFP